ncbi:major facilitator superfamily domain-containing protein [Podospora didyma]|uniref:Major facilitator superfamily domain-containing protein n=1 Tax=Podospora didyma TaxID=330526 RepID=A0AAE0N6I3_9PEZI|nr:major facilitator superfamily domain-containing protein [Podospora didyma]
MANMPGITGQCFSFSTSVTTQCYSSPTKKKTPKEKAATLSSCQVGLLIFTLYCGSFLVALDASVVSNAVPKITSEFASLAHFTWYHVGYLHSLGPLQPIFARVCRVANPKIVYMGCLFVLEVGSIVCAASHSSRVFIAGRFIAGVGAAGVFHAAIAIINKTIRLESRRHCIGIVNSAGAVAACAGPIFAGLFVDHATWRWAFWINVPTGFLVLFLVLCIPQPPQPTWQKETFGSMTWKQRIQVVDPIGWIFMVGASMCSTLPGTFGTPWPDETVPYVLLATAPLLTYVYIYWSQQWHGRDAVMPKWLFRERSAFVCALFSIFIASAESIQICYLPFFFQAAREISATRSGLWCLVFFFPKAGFAIITGVLVNKFGTVRLQMILGAAVATIGSMMAMILMFFDIDPDIVRVAPLVVGIGLGLATNLPYIVAITTLPQERIAAALVSLQFCYHFGSILYLGVAQLTFVDKLKNFVETLTPTTSMEAVFHAGAANLRGLAHGSEDTYQLLRQVYLSALAYTLYVPAICVAVALGVAFIVQDRSYLRVPKERRNRNPMDFKV